MQVCSSTYPGFSYKYVLPWAGSSPVRAGLLPPHLRFYKLLTITVPFIIDMSRFLYSLVVVLFASLYSAFAAPFPLKEGASVNLAARASNVYRGDVGFPRI